MYIFSESKKVLCVAAVAFSLVIPSVVGATPTKKKQSSVAALALPAVVARVNGVEIRGADLEKEITNFTKRRSGGHHGVTDTQKPADLQRVVLDRMIGAELLYQVAQQHPFADRDKQVTATISELKGRFPDQKSFQAALAEQGINEEIFQKLVVFNVVLENYVKTVVIPSITPSELDIKAFYAANPQAFKQEEGVRASHILIAVAETATPADREKARVTMEAIEKQLQSGAAFEELAKKHSACPSGSKGGDLQFFGRGQMVKPFEEAAFALKPGQVSGIVSTQFGYHLIKLTDRRAAGTIPLEAARQSILEELQQQRLGQALDTLQVEQLKKAKVEIYLKS